MTTETDPTPDSAPVAGERTPFTIPLTDKEFKQIFGANKPKPTLGPDRTLRSCVEKKGRLSVSIDRGDTRCDFDIRAKADRFRIENIEPSMWMDLQIESSPDGALFVICDGWVVVARLVAGTHPGGRLNVFAYDRETYGPMGSAQRPIPVTPLYNPLVKGKDNDEVEIQVAALKRLR